MITSLISYELGKLTYRRFLYILYKMKNYCFTLLFCCCATIVCAQSVRDTKESLSIELLKNPSFEEEAKPIRNRRFGPNGEGELFGARLPEGIILGWITPNNQEEASQMELVSDNLVDTAQCKALCWTIENAPATIANVGFQGVEAIKGQQYSLTFWGRADKKYKGTLRIGLQSKRTGAWYAEAKVKGKIKKRWKRYTLTFTAREEDPKAHFVIVADKPGVLYLDCVSLTAR